jgi:hypothetical protein
MPQASGTFNLCLQLSRWKEPKVIMSPKPSKNPAFLQNVCHITLLSTTDKLFEELTLKIMQMQIEERGVLYGFHAHHRGTLQCMRLADPITLHLNNNMSRAAAFLDIEKTFHTPWHLGLLYKLSILIFNQFNQAY